MLHYKSVQAGTYRVLVVQPEQLRPLGGHVPRLAQIIRHSQFSKLVKRVHVDEAHNIYTAGISLYDQPAFRPAWGHLHLKKMILQHSAMSSTLLNLQILRPPFNIVQYSCH
jgi:hypothetical protein